MPFQPGNQLGKRFTPATETPTPDVDDANDPMAQLAAVFSAASKDKRKVSTAISELETVLAKLDPKDTAELLKNEVVAQFFEQVSEAKVVQNAELPPGTVIGTGLGATAVPWTLRYLHKLREQGAVNVVKFLPQTTQLVCWNGLFHQFVADMEEWVYEPFVSVYNESRAAARDSVNHANWLLKTGAWDPRHGNPPAPNPDWLLDSGAISRSVGQGTYTPGSGTSGMDAREVPAEAAA